LGEGFRAHLGEQVVGGVQLVTGLGPAVLATEPLAEEQVAPGCFGAKRCTSQPLDRLGVALLGLLAFSDQPPARLTSALSRRWPGRPRRRRRTRCGAGT